MNVQVGFLAGQDREVAAIDNTISGDMALDGPYGTIDRIVAQVSDAV